MFHKLLQRQFFNTSVRSFSTLVLAETKQNVLNSSIYKVLNATKKLNQEVKPLLRLLISLKKKIYISHRIIISYTNPTSNRAYALLTR